MKLDPVLPVEILGLGADTSRAYKNKSFLQNARREPLEMRGEK